MAVDNCCFCFELRKGIYIFGSFLAIISLIFIPVYYSIEDEDKPKINGKNASAVYIGLDVVNFIIRATLVYGAYKKSRGFLLPYLIVEFFFLSIATFVCISLTSRNLRSVMIGEILGLAFLWYYWYCVLRLYYNLDPRNLNQIPKELPNTDKVYIGLPNNTKPENIAATYV